MTCEHATFEARVKVNRLVDIGRFTADVTVKCTSCDVPFRWLGLDTGASFAGPRVSLDGLELRAPIEPEDD